MTTVQQLEAKIAAIKSEIAAIGYVTSYNSPTAYARKAYLEGRLTSVEYPALALAQAREYADARISPWGPPPPLIRDPGTPETEGDWSPCDCENCTATGNYFSGAAGAKPETKPAKSAADDFPWLWLLLAVFIGWALGYQKKGRA